MEVPGDGLGTVVERAVLVVKEALEMRLVTGQVAERGGVLEGEGEGIEGVVETQEADGAGEVAGGAQGGKGVGGGTEANVPDDELAGVALEAVDEAELADVEGLGFGNGADDGVEGLVVGEGMDAVRAIGELYDSVSGGGFHGGNLEQGRPEAKPKGMMRDA